MLQMALFQQFRKRLTADPGSEELSTDGYNTLGKTGTAGASCSEPQDDGTAFRKIDESWPT